MRELLPFKVRFQSQVMVHCGHVMFAGTWRPMDWCNGEKVPPQCPLHGVEVYPFFMCTENTHSL
jgi:hypothetical protein